MRKVYLMLSQLYRLKMNHRHLCIQNIGRRFLYSGTLEVNAASLRVKPIDETTIRRSRFAKLLFGLLLEDERET